MQMHFKGKVEKSDMNDNLNHLDDVGIKIIDEQYFQEDDIEIWDSTSINLAKSSPNIVSYNQTKYLKKQKFSKYLVLFSQIFLLIAFLGTWEWTSNTGILNSFIFSSPTKIGTCFMEMVADGSIYGHVWITLYETLISFVLVTICSVLCAVILWFFPRLSQVLEPYLVTLNSLPKSALAPLLIVWLGANTKTIIVAGMSVAIFGSIISLHTNFKQVDTEKIKLIYTLGGKKLQALSKVVIPSSIPTIISIMKVNIGLCLVGVVIGEFLAARSGLGYLIIYSSQVFKMDWLLMSIILLCIMAMLLYAFISIIEKWYHKK